MDLLAAGLVGLTAAGVAGVVSVVVAGRWYERAGEPVVDVPGPEYARRLIDGTGYAVEEDAWAESSHCDYRRRKVVLTPGCWGPGLRGVLVAAHEAGHARFDRGPAVWLAVPRVRFVAVLAWLAAVLLAGRLRAPGLAFVAVGGSLALVADRAWGGEGLPFRPGCSRPRFPGCGVPGVDRGLGTGGGVLRGAGVAGPCASFLVGCGRPVRVCLGGAGVGCCSFGRMRDCAS